MSREKSSSGGGLSIQTLLISSLSAVAAAIVVPLFWQKGTILATAMTPIIVALANEALRRPAERISSVAPRVARRTATGAAIRRFDPQAARTRHPERVGARGAGPERFEPLGDHEGVSPEDPFGLRTPARRRSWWKAGLVTGIVAFVIVAAIVTASELTIFGGSISGRNEQTSLFGGKKHASGSSSQEKTTPRASPTPGASATASPTPTPTPTATPSATATSTPAPTSTATAQPQASPTP